MLAPSRTAHTPAHTPHTHNRHRERHTHTRNARPHTRPPSPYARRTPPPERQRSDIAHRRATTFEAVVLSRCVTSTALARSRPWTAVAPGTIQQVVARAEHDAVSFICLASCFVHLPDHASGTPWLRAQDSSRRRDIGAVRARRTPQMCSGPPADARAKGPGRHAHHTHTHHGHARHRHAADTQEAAIRT